MPLVLNQSLARSVVSLSLGAHIFFVTFCFLILTTQNGSVSVLIISALCKASWVKKNVLQMLMLFPRCLAHRQVMAMYIILCLQLFNSNITEIMLIESQCQN